MNKFFTVLAAGVAAVGAVAVTAFALGTGVNGEKVAADLTLIGKGEFIGVHFSPTFEEDLSEKERIVYHALEKGIFGFERHIDISSAGYTDADELTAFLNQVININPAWNSIDDKIEYVMAEDCISQILLDYTTPKLMLTALADEYTPSQSVIDHALAEIEEGMSTVEKALIIHDYLVREVDYSLGVVNNEPYSNDVFTLKGVFVNHEAVCAGYALAYSYLLEKVGVESTIVASDPMNHAWNMINVDGEWYHVDVTWDDPTNKTEVDFCRGGFVSHEYFLRSDEEFLNEYGHYNWTQEYTYSDAPKSGPSGAFDNWSFRPMNADGTEGNVGMLSYVDGYFYGLSDIWGSDVLVRTNVEGTDRAEIKLPESYKYMFCFNGKLYANTSNRIWELETNGSVVRMVAATPDTIRNFWLKQNVLAYYNVDEYGKAERKVVDLHNGVTNLVTENGYSFILGDDGTATVLEYVGEPRGDMTIPQTVCGCTVTKIGPNAFNSFKGTKIVIPEGVTTIEQCAFMYSKFSEIILPNSLVTIGDHAFFNCNNIESIHIRKNVNSIGRQAFYACIDLKTVYFHADVPQFWGAEVFGNPDREGWEKIEDQLEIKHHSTRRGWTDGVWVSPNGVEFKSSLFGSRVLDVNHDGIANGQDIAFMVDVYTHPDDHTSADCHHKTQCDCNEDGIADESDAVYMLWELIRGFDD